MPSDLVTALREQARSEEDVGLAMTADHIERIEAEVARLQGLLEARLMSTTRAEAEGRRQGHADAVATLRGLCRPTPMRQVADSLDFRLWQLRKGDADAD